MRISETKEGHLDLVDLENQLQFQHALEGSDRTLIGCFSAASNITGILADDIATTLLLHQYGALAFWDYATAGELYISAARGYLEEHLRYISVYIVRN